MRKSRILPKVAWHANMTDGRRVEMMDTANMSATTLGAGHERRRRGRRRRRLG
jgi:hypothetical protein